MMLRIIILPISDLSVKFQLHRQILFRTLYGHLQGRLMMMIIAMLHGVSLPVVMHRMPLILCQVLQVLK